MNGMSCTTFYELFAPTGVDEFLVDGRQPGKFEMVSLGTFVPLTSRQYFASLRNEEAEDFDGTSQNGDRGSEGGLGTGSDGASEDTDRGYEARST
jgi:hypothetical protein